MHATTITVFDTPCIRLEAEGASALVALHGAHVLSWVPVDGRERLFLSERSRFTEGASIRGGIPVIFPQFSERGAFRRHGFARLRPWRFVGVEATQAVFEISTTSEDRDWPFASLIQLRIALTATQLTVMLVVKNSGTVPFHFTAALHTYLAVSDSRNAQLEGLQGCDYEDSANGGTLHRQSDYTVMFEGETDRIYSDVVAPLVLTDGAHTLEISQEGFGDAVVWNPGERLAAGIGDLAPGDWQRFICVEAGQVLQPVVLTLGETWCGVQWLNSGV